MHIYVIGNIMPAKIFGFHFRDLPLTYYQYCINSQKKLESFDSYRPFDSIPSRDSVGKSIFNINNCASIRPLGKLIEYSSRSCGFTDFAPLENSDQSELTNKEYITSSSTFQWLNPFENVLNIVIRKISDLSLAGIYSNLKSAETADPTFIYNFDQLSKIFGDSERTRGLVRDMSGMKLPIQIFLDNNYPVIENAFKLLNRSLANVWSNSVEQNASILKEHILTNIVGQASQAPAQQSIVQIRRRIDPTSSVNPSCGMIVTKIDITTPKLFGLSTLRIIPDLEDVSEPKVNIDGFTVPDICSTDSINGEEEQSVLLDSIPPPDSFVARGLSDIYGFLGKYSTIVSTRNPTTSFVNGNRQN